MSSAQRRTRIGVVVAAVRDDETGTGQYVETADDIKARQRVWQSRRRTGEFPLSKTGIGRNDSDGLPIVPTESPAASMTVMGYVREVMTKIESPATATRLVAKLPQ